MHSLSALEIVQVWEIGHSQHPLDRALTLLSFAMPELTGNDLVRLSIGQRDALLLNLRERTLGPTLESFAECPQCQEPLEFTLNAADLKAIAPVTSPPDSTYLLAVEDVELHFRLPNSQDLAMVVGCEDLSIAATLLMQRCIQQARHKGQAIEFHQLSAQVLNQLASRIVECDPQAEMLLDLTCPACQHSWQLLFDIVTFFWTELSVQAKRLLREVHTLARCYGWREADILAMSAMRRQFYLNQN
jgi:T4 bacteriophage base plate protein